MKDTPEDKEKMLASAIKAAKMSPMTRAHMQIDDDTTEDKDDTPVDTGTFMPCFALAPHTDELVRAYVNVDTIVGVEEAELSGEPLTAITTVAMAYYFIKLDLEETLELIAQYTI